MKAKQKGLRKGDRVRDAKWGGQFTGTVVRTATREGERRVFVQWDNIAVEDELPETQVTPLRKRIKGDIESVVKKLELEWRGRRT
ncbi:MAG: hypothetical protein HYT79_02705 [Elusimicrobia bacterium]|nr:hypothetical protein [Elusimicrobiota bacterium]